MFVPVRSFHKQALHLMLLLVNELAGGMSHVRRAADVAVAARRCERAAADHVYTRCWRSE